MVSKIIRNVVVKNILSIIFILLIGFLFCSLTKLNVTDKEKSINLYGKTKKIQIIDEEFSLEQKDSLVHRQNDKISVKERSDLGQEEEVVLKTRNEAVNSISDYKTYYIQLCWEDDTNNEHPIAYTKFDFIIHSGANKITNTYYTDSNGYFPSEITVNNSDDVDIKIYAAGINTSVHKNTFLGINSDWYYIRQNLEPNVVKMVFPVDMQTDYGKVQQISQALIFADRFTTIMRGNAVSSVEAIYPSDSTHYNRASKKIYLLGEGNDLDYADWDVIMHEYGHHVANEMNIDDSPGGWHKSDINMIDHYSGNSTTSCSSQCARHKNGGFSASEAKIQGKKIAWSEAWATVFGAIAQEYFANELINIVGVADKGYSDSWGGSGGTPIYYYNTIVNNKGEGCERTIIGVLWDLFDYDEEGESNDTIYLDYQKWWNVTTGSQATTFSGFVKYFYSHYWNYIGEVGKNLEYYGMAPALSVSNAVDEINSSMQPMTFSWVPQGGSQQYLNNNFQLLFYNEDFTDKYMLSVGSLTSKEIGPSIFESIKGLKGQVVHVAVRGYHSSNSIYDGYVSSCIDFPKRVFTYSLTDNKATITGAYCDLIGNTTIPATIDGYQIEEIGEWALSGKSFNYISFASDSTVHTLGCYAFYSCPNLGIFVAPSSLVTVEDYVFTNCNPLLFSYTGTSLKNIGEGVFMNTNMQLNAFIPKSVETIGTYAYKNSSFSDKFALSANSALRSIGDYAFENHTMKSIVLSNTVSDIGVGAFNGCNFITIYTERSVRPSTWNVNWNGSNRPVFWGCTLSSDKNYVVSFVKSDSNPVNINASNGISTPFRSGYTFGGWYTTSDFSGTQYTDVTAAPNGTLYAKWIKNSCVAEGTLITLADGSQVAVENLTGNENLLVWNMLTGQFDVAPILFIDSDPVSSYEIIKLTFSDGTEVKVIDEHAFFDMTLNKYVFLRNDAAQYIGHTFNKQTVDENGEKVWTAVTLTDVTVYTETTSAWSPVTYGHLCYYVNGMLSMPGATEGFINIFEVNGTLMKYDEEQMAEDIAEYGLFTYEEFNEIIPVPEIIFNAFNGQYLKVSVGKGLITLDQIRVLIERYSAYFA